MDKSLRNSLIIGGFIASAILTVCVPTDEDGKSGTSSDSTLVTSSENNRRVQDILQQELKDLSQTESGDNQNVHVSTPIEGDPYEELNSLIGLESVKEEVNSLANFVRVQKQREARGLKTSSVSYHCVFTGNPGTGKTTVARILARIYKDLGIVKKGHLVETDRSGLIAEYVGQTAVKTNAVVDSALNGILFIDEAYALLDGNGGYGDEAIATLLKRMEDDRDRLVVIVAGYTNEMKRFIDANPGLQSRFTRYINFPDYSADDLYKIFMTRINKYSYKLDADAEKFLRNDLAQTVAHKSRNFGNARYVRNLFEKVITNQANRLGNSQNLTADELSQITLDDVTSACKTVTK
ncbi:MAG: AAA family ATPase [Bacteroidaceae bacterium]|nr:AAA family ATPase [Bacteroidaceae bacterium]